MKLSKMQYEIWDYVSKTQPTPLKEVCSRWPKSSLDALCKKGVLKINDYQHVEES